LLTCFTPWYADVVNFDYAVRTTDLGLVPYAQVKIEYPPLAYEVMTLPRRFATERITVEQLKKQAPAQFAAYEFRFRAIMLSAEALAFGLLLLTVAARGPDRLAMAAWAYLACSTPLAHVLDTRLDAGLLLLLMAWAWCWTLATRSRSLTFGCFAWLTVGLGVSYKLFPLVMVPLLGVAELRGPDRQSRRRRVSFACLYLLAGLVFPYLPLLSTAGRHSLDWLRFHAERGVEIESVYSALMLLMAAIGLPVQAVQGPGSWDLASPWSSTFAGLSTWITMTALAALFFRCVRSKAGSARDDAFRLSCLAVLVTVVLGKVLSPQFLVFALPLALIVGIDVLEQGPTRLLAIALCATAILTAAVFPYLFFAGTSFPYEGMTRTSPWGLVPRLDVLPVALLVARDGLLLAVTSILARRTWALRPLPASQAAPIALAAQS